MSPPRPAPIVCLHTDCALVLLPEPAQCACGLFVVLMVNRGGQTRCVQCDTRGAGENPLASAPK